MIYYNHRKEVITIKTPKTYRLSQISLEKLKELKELHPDYTETEIVEWAILNTWATEKRRVIVEWRKNNE